MGLFSRKRSRKSRLFRVHISRSGINYSFGVPGLRIGTGPRGAYISMSAGGVTCRMPLGQKDNKPKSVPANISPLISQEPQLKEIESADTDQLTDVSSKEILEKINRSTKRFPFWVLPLLAIVPLFILYFNKTFPQEYILTAILACLGLLAILAAFGGERKFRLTYSDSEDTQDAIDTLNQVLSFLPKCQHVWHVPGYVDDIAIHLKRNPISIKKVRPNFVDTNIDVYCIPVGKQNLYFFPDRLYITEGNRVAILDYGELKIDVERVTMTDRNYLPEDAPIVNQTWEHVRTDGQPDKRYRDNPMVFTFEYGYIHFRSSTGLNELLQVSNPVVAEKFKELFDMLGPEISEAVNKKDSKEE